MGAQTFVDQFGGDLGPDAIDHRANGVVGRARLSTDASSGVEVGVLDGYSAVVGSGAAIKIVFEDGRLAVGARHVAVARARAEPSAGGPDAHPRRIRPDRRRIRRWCRSGERWC